MSIKSILNRMIPSLRMGHAILGYCDCFSKEIKALNNRINDLDSKNEYLFWLSQRLIDETDMETKKRVFLDMPKATGELRSIQLAENFILQRIKKHADELDISFFLFGGTALGAVRHKGFIPWDDDVDLGMLQDDYQRLKQKIDKEDDLIWVNRYYQADGGSVIKAKFRFSDNFFVDIFTFERIGVDESKINDYWLMSQQLTKECSRLIVKKLTEMNLLEKAFKTPVYNVELDNYAKGLHRNIEAETQVDDKNDFYIAESIANGYNFRSQRMYWKSEDVFPLLTDEVEFEGETYSMVNQYKKRLEIFFGDIWAIPNSINCKHNSEFDDNLRKDIIHLKQIGII